MIGSICFAALTPPPPPGLSLLENLGTDHLYCRLIREAHKKGAKIVLVQVNLYVTNKIFS
jgi:hypothetical protein